MVEEPDFIDKWTRERVLGSGAFGIVTLWKNETTNEKIAIKKYRGELNNITPKQKERWTKEVEMMQRIENSNIVCCRKLPNDFEKELQKYNPSMLPMLSMEYCTEGDLRALLSKGENCCGLPESDVRYILADLSNALSYLHNLRITHRDLKPENVVLQTCDRQNNIIYKLIDLGYAKEIDASSVAASFVGTMQYLAPEFFYSKTYSCSVDYWSLGLVAFEVICGVRPFLPNKSPAQWMNYVQKKNSEDICIYEKDNNEIVYSKEIYLENHISSCFKREMEKWLQMSLEFDPKKRGYDHNESHRSNNEPSIFTYLNHILHKKIITVFSVFTHKFLSYEIDDFTLITTLKGWIERDTKVPKNEQILFSSGCENINIEGLAIQLFDQTYSVEPMLYVFKKNYIMQQEVFPDIPVLVQSMLENSKTLPYYFQKISYGHALYFTFKENKLYNTTLDACNLRIKHLLQLFNEIQEKCNIMMKNMQVLNAQKIFSKDVLDFDVSQYLNHFSQSATHWTDSFNTVVREVEKIFELSQRLVVRYESAYRRVRVINEASEKQYSKYSKHNLNKMLNEALDVYKMVKKKPKEKRSKPDTCTEMMMVLYNVLKCRDKLLKDKAFAQYHQKILDIELEVDKMLLPLNTSLQHIEKIKLDLFNDHISRQTKIWELTVKQKTKPKSVKPNVSEEEPKTNFIIGNDHNKEYDNPISLEKPLHFMLGEIQSTSRESISSNATKNNDRINNENCSSTDNQNKSMVQNSENCGVKKTVNFQIGAPTSMLINNNQTLRYELQEKTNESFLKCKSILSENLDFSFLDQV